MLVWRIRSKDRTFGERYSDGGDNPLFCGDVDEVKSEQAIWVDKKELNEHIARVMKRSPRSYMNAEVVGYRLVEEKVEDLTPKALGAQL